MRPTGLFFCPHCGEEVDTSPDPDDGEEQSYIEDCPVCCRPNMIHAVYDPDADGFYIDASAEV